MGVHHSAKGASLPSQHLPGPFSNGLYGVAFPLVVHERVMGVGWEM